MTVQKVGVGRVNVARLHRDQVSDELVGGLHGLLKKGDNGAVHLLLERRIPAVELFGQQL